MLTIVATPAAPQAAPTACYEIFVRSFYDSDGDGIGDLRGLTRKLDYIANLGVDCVWLMPVAESPSYHGYDVTNYYRVEPDYGTNEDFTQFVGAAHRRGIRVLVDLVLNHVSSDHPVFREALRDTASPYRAWFHWSPTRGPDNEWGDNNWHRSPLRDEYYYGFFWSGMPDLNFDHPPVMAEAKRIARFWLEEMDVDGFRLDAVRHLIEAPGRSTHVPGTHAALRELGDYIRGVAPRSFTIGEVWDSTGAVLPYYPDQLDAYFAFDVSDSILSAVRTGSATGLLAPVLRLQRLVPAQRWAPFLRNHDQTRTLTVLGGDRAAARVAAALLLTLPGVPFIYYGEEIGMSGDKPDERLRTPMHWTGGRAAGFTTGTPWQPLQPDSLTANVQAQDADSGSLLNWYRYLIGLRRSNDALARGELVPVDSGDPRVATYVRRTDEQAVQVMINLETGAVRIEEVCPAGRLRPLHR